MQLAKQLSKSLIFAETDSIWMSLQKNISFPSRASNKHVYLRLECEQLNPSVQLPTEFKWIKSSDAKKKTSFRAAKPIDVLCGSRIKAKI